MSFRAFNKTLSEEIENLFANLGDSQAPEEARRLDPHAEEIASVDIQELLRKIQSLDQEETEAAKTAPKPPQS